MFLQASIEYVRYLEDCVAKLKAQQEQQQQSNSSSRPEASSSHSPLPPIREFHPTFRDDDPVDVEMMTDDSDAAPSPVFTAQQQQQHHLQNHQQEQHRRTSVSVSPALHAQDSRHRQHSYSSASTAADQRHYSFSASTTTTSPAFGPQLFSYNNHAHGGSASGSTLTSPALLPQTDHDHEATAALLMLNCDRRGTVGRNGSANNVNRALSVRDLLSS